MAAVLLDKIEPTRKTGPLSGGQEISGFTVTFSLDVTEQPWVVALSVPDQSADAAVASAKTKLHALLSELVASIDQVRP